MDDASISLKNAHPPLQLGYRGGGIRKRLDPIHVRRERALISPYRIGSLFPRTHSHNFAVRAGARLFTIVG